EDQRRDQCLQQGHEDGADGLQGGGQPVRAVTAVLAGAGDRAQLGGHEAEDHAEDQADQDLPAEGDADDRAQRVAPGRRGRGGGGRGAHERSRYAAALPLSTRFLSGHISWTWGFGPRSSERLGCGPVRAVPVCGCLCPRPRAARNASRSAGEFSTQNWLPSGSGMTTHPLPGPPISGDRRTGAVRTPPAGGCAPASAAASMSACLSTVRTAASSPTSTTAAAPGTTTTWSTPATACSTPRSRWSSMGSSTIRRPRRRRG